jgi:SAM-dependent methyltransferase
MDLVAVLSPTDFSMSASVCRVGVHIVSREGTGRAVQRALDPYVDKFLDAEGDAYRFGPGGYIELLVRLKSVQEILRNSAVRDRVVRELGLKHKGQILISDLIEFIEDEVQNVLRSDIDDQATVQLILGPIKDVIDDWLRNAPDPFPHGFELASTSASVYGAASRYSLVAHDPALAEIKQYLRAQNGATDTNTLTVECVYSYTTLEAFFILKALDLRRQVRAEVLSAIESEQDHVTLGFMRVAEQMNLNLSSLKHGPYGSYIVDFELPITPYGAEQETYNALILNELRDELNKQNVEIAFVSSLSTVLGKLEREEDDMSDTEIAFADGPALTDSNIEYVTDPEVFHRYMRKHLFIPDSDAAILAIATDLLSQEKQTEYRVLEIGSGTGALTEKLIQSGIVNLDTIEPDQKMSEYWENLKKVANIDQRGNHYSEKLESFARTVDQKYDLIVSQGVHHHIPTRVNYRNESRRDENYRLTFLSICRSLLKPGKSYILSDEFLTDYHHDEESRIKNLDRWYSRVISTASADGYNELADLEYGFWLNDRTKTVEYKESIEEFRERLEKAGAAAPFEIKSVTKFGMTEEYGGGFGVIVLKQKEL